MSFEDIENALVITRYLIDNEKNSENVEQLLKLQNVLQSAKNRVNQSITFDCFAGAITDSSGYLEELESCLNEVHQQISDELNKSSQCDTKFLGNKLSPEVKLHRLSDDEGIGLPDSIKTDESDLNDNMSLITSLSYQPTSVEKGIIELTRSQYNLNLIDKDRTELYIENLEKELLVCKTRERELILDRSDLLEKIRMIHGVLEEKQYQLNNYVNEWEEKLRRAEQEKESVIRERDEVLAERSNILQERDGLAAERDAISTERDNLAAERDTMESDKWDIMKQLREAEERCGCLQQEIKYRDNAIKSLQDENERFSQECICNSVDSLPSRTMSRSSSLRSRSSMSSKGSGLSRILTLRSNKHAESVISDADSFGSEEASVTNPKKRNKSRINFPLFTDDTEREKRKLLESLKEVPMSRWKSEAVMAWLELVVDMPMYSKACAANVKSGKVLLSLSDHDIQTGFGMINPLHKRKLRLALDDAKSPESITYPLLPKLRHMWVVDEWLPSIGLNQYKGVFRENLVDGRVLNSLTKKDIERNLNIVDKAHQVSLMLGIELLAKYGYNIKDLNEKRAGCQNIDRDVEVWTTGRVAEWLVSIDLKEYANKLSYSGIHGAVIVNDKDFTVDTLASGLGIPVQRKVLRRHMEQELTVLKSGGSKRHTLSTRSHGKSSGRHLKDQLTRAFNSKADSNELTLKAFNPPTDITACRKDPDNKIKLKFDPEVYA